MEKTELEELKKEVTELKAKFSFLLGFVDGLKSNKVIHPLDNKSSIVSASEYADGHLMTRDEAIRKQNDE